MAWDIGCFQLSDVGKGQRTPKKPVGVILFVAALRGSYGSSTKVIIFPLKTRAEAVLCACTLLLLVLYFDRRHA